MAITILLMEGSCEQKSRALQRRRCADRQSLSLQDILTCRRIFERSLYFRVVLWLQARCVSHAHAALRTGAEVLEFSAIVCVE